MSELRIKKESGGEQTSEKRIAKLETSVSTLAESLNQLAESLGGAKTSLERKSIAQKHIADTDGINKRRNRAVPIFGDNTAKVGEDFLIKGVTPDIPRKEAQANFIKALKSPTDNANLAEFQVRCDRVKMKCELLGKKPYELEEYQEWQDFLEKTGYDEIVKVITTSTTTDYIPEGWSNQIEKYYYLALKVAMLFNEFDMPSRQFTWDLLGRPEAHYRAEQTASARGTAANEVTASDPVQGVVQFTAKKLTVRVDVTDEFVEDSIDMYYETLSQEMIPEAIAEGMEIAVLNGDSDGTHQDSGTAATSPASAWNGLRKRAIQRGATVDVTADSGSFDYGRLTEIIGEGGKYLITPGDTAWVCGIDAYAEILNFDEVKTVDNFGDMATNVQGAVMMLMGRPLIVSEHIPLVHDAGFVDATAANNVHDTLLLVNKKQFRCGRRPRAEMTEVMYDPLTQFYYFIATIRKDFQAMQPIEAGYTPVAQTLKI